MIIDHTHPIYREKRKSLENGNKYNGAYYYSQEIVKNIIPRIKTDRSWVTINQVTPRINHAIVFVHDNIKPEVSMSWLGYSRDIILVCGVKETMDKVKHLGTPVYLPLSVDVPYILQFRSEKTKEIAYVGRPDKPGMENLPKNVDYLSGISREALLKELAKSKKGMQSGDVQLKPKFLGVKFCHLMKDTQIRVFGK